MDIFDQLQLGVQIIDSDMKYVYLNPYLLQSLPLSLEEHIGKKMEEVYTDIEKSQIYSEIKKCFETNEVRSFINEFIFEEDGSITYWKLDLQRIPQGVIIFCRDITSSKTGEIQLKETNSKLELLVDKRTQDLTEANRKIKKIISYVAHDLRNPIANVISIAELVKDPKFREDDSFIDCIISSGNECLEIVTTLLEEGAILDGKIKLTKEKIYLGKFINSILHHDISINKSRLQIHLTSKIIVKIDKKRIKQVIKNLLTNAKKYSIDESPIWINLDPNAVFSIKNEIDHQKVITAKESTGYGLEITNSILKLHDLQLVTEKDNDEFTALIDCSPVLYKK